MGVLGVFLPPAAEGCAPVQTSTGVLLVVVVVVVEEWVGMTLTLPFQGTIIKHLGG